MTSIVWKMEDDLNFFGNGRRPQFLGKMEDDLIFFWQNGRQPNFVWQKGRRPQMLDKWKMTFNVR